jgi:hypothetical protein
MSTHPCIPGRQRAISVSVNSLSARALERAGEQAGPFIMLTLSLRGNECVHRGALLSVRQAVELHRDLGRHIDAALAEVGAVGDSKPLTPARRKGRGLDLKPRRRGRRKRSVA